MYNQIIYRSRATFPRGHLSDLDILRSALERNSVSDLTGYLLRSANGFLQAIEGPEIELRATFAKIDSDSRHHSIHILADVQRTQRYFPQWSMGY